MELLIYYGSKIICIGFVSLTPILEKHITGSHGNHAFLHIPK